MDRYPLMTWMLLLALGGTPLVTAAPTDDRVLVLRSGAVLEGTIERLPDRFRIALPSGGQATIPLAEVQFAAKSLAAAYVRRSDRIDAGNLEQQLALARWCWQTGLRAEARRHLAQAESLAPHDRRLAAMQHQFQEAPPPQAATAQPPRIEQPAMPVVQATYEVPVTAPPDDDVATVPKELLRSFTRHIQPLLLTRCAGCHQVGQSRPFALRSPSGRGLMPPAVSAANFRAVRAQVTQVGSLEFVKRARDQHAGSVPISDKESQRLLEPWLARLAASQASPTTDANSRRGQPGDLSARPAAGPGSSKLLPVGKPLPAGKPLSVGEPLPVGDPFDPAPFHAAEEESPPPDPPAGPTG